MDNHKFLRVADSNYDLPLWKTLPDLLSLFFGNRVLVVHAFIDHLVLEVECLLLLLQGPKSLVKLLLPHRVIGTELCHYVLIQFKR